MLHRAATLTLFAVLLGLTRAEAQGLTGIEAQHRLHQQWRATVELGGMLTAGFGASLGSYRVSDGLLRQPMGGVSVWRGLHPSLDWGVGVWAQGPLVDLALPNVEGRCASYEQSVPGTDSYYPSVLGVTGQAMTGMRFRPWGAGVPFYVVGMVGASARWLWTRSHDGTRCVSLDPITGQPVSRPPNDPPPRAATVPGLAWMIGIQNHFGAREQWVFGTSFWLNVDGIAGARSEINPSLQFHLGYTPGSEPDLPADARRRIQRARNRTFAVVGSVVGAVSLVYLSMWVMYTS